MHWVIYDQISGVFARGDDRYFWDYMNDARLRGMFPSVRWFNTEQEAINIGPEDFEKCETSSPN